MFVFVAMCADFFFSCPSLYDKLALCQALNLAFNISRDYDIIGLL